MCLALAVQSTRTITKFNPIHFFCPLSFMARASGDQPGALCLHACAGLLDLRLKFFFRLVVRIFTGLRSRPVNLLPRRRCQMRQLLEL